VTQWQVETVRIAVPPPDLGEGPAVVLPEGWEPLAAMRQGETVIVLCRQPVASTPPGGNAPVLDSLTPNSLPTGSSPATVTVNGSNFDNTCEVCADGQPRATFYIDPHTLEYTARPDLASSGESHQITVQGSGGTSSALTFTFT
jgi:hypothetical protein